MNAIVSGAGKGIGRAITIALAKEGYNLAIGSRTITDLEKLVSELKAINPQIEVLMFPVDFADKDSILKFTESIQNKWRRIDVLVNNVGSYAEGLLSEEGDEQLEKHLKTNLFSAYYLSREFLPLLKQQRHGHIFNVLSVAAITPVKQAASYSISKYALMAFHKLLLEEMRAYWVKVTGLIPGSTYTSSWSESDVESKKLVQPEDIAAALINALRMPAGTNVEEIIITPTNF